MMKCLVGKGFLHFNGNYKKNFEQQMSTFWKKYKVHLMFLSGLILFMVSFLIKEEGMRYFSLGFLTVGIVLLLENLSIKKKI